jgi:hypothetical protein
LKRQEAKPNESQNKEFACVSNTFHNSWYYLLLSACQDTKAVSLEWGTANICGKGVYFSVWLFTLSDLPEIQEKRIGVQINHLLFGNNMLNYLSAIF